MFNKKLDFYQMNIKLRVQTVNNNISETSEITDSCYSKPLFASITESVALSEFLLSHTCYVRSLCFGDEFVFLSQNLSTVPKKEIVAKT